MTNWTFDKVRFDVIEIVNNNQQTHALTRISELLLSDNNNT